MRGRYRQWKMQRAKKKFQVYMRKHDGRRSLGELAQWLRDLAATRIVRWYVF